MQRYWKQLPASVWCQEFVKLMHERGTSIEWIKKTWHPYLDKMKDDFEKDGSQYCSHFCSRIGKLPHMFATSPSGMAWPPPIEIGLDPKWAVPPDEIEVPVPYRLLGLPTPPDEIEVPIPALLWPLPSVPWPPPQPPPCRSPFPLH